MTNHTRGGHGVRRRAKEKKPRKCKARDVRAALKRLEREGEKPSEHEITAWDFY